MTYFCSTWDQEENHKDSQVQIGRIRARKSISGPGTGYFLAIFGSAISQEWLFSGSGIDQSGPGYFAQFGTNHPARWWVRQGGLFFLARNGLTFWNHPILALFRVRNWPLCLTQLFLQKENFSSISVMLAYILKKRLLWIQITTLWG